MQPKTITERNERGYRQFCEKHGYKFCETYDWTSSAGDWTFIVSKSGKVWRVLWQENMIWRGGGFDVTLGDRLYYGTGDVVLKQIYREQLLQELGSGFRRDAAIERELAELEVA